MIHNQVFGGIIPKLADSLLPNGFAIKALNCNLENGNLRPWPEPKRLCTYEENIRHIHYLGVETGYGPEYETQCWCEFKGTVAAADIVRCEELGAYIKLEDNVLQISTDRFICADNGWHDLVIPPPSHAMVVDDYSDTVVEDDQCVAYFFFTYVNEYGMESPPSPVTRRIEPDGSSPNRVKLYMPMSAPTAAEKIRIYRTESGYVTRAENTATDLTKFFLAREVHPSERIVSFVPSMESTLRYDGGTNLRPPIEMSHLGMMRNGCLIGAQDKNVYFSAAPSAIPRYNQWPDDRDLLLEHNVQGMVTNDYGSFLITDGQPYFIGFNAGEGGYGFQEQKADLVAPLASEGSIVDIGNGVIYLSTKGIVRLAPSAGGQAFSARVISNDLFSHEQWRDLDLRDAQAVAWDGKYMFLTRDTGYILHYESRDEPVSEKYLPMTEIDLHGLPDSMAVDADNTVHYLRDGQLWQWDLTSTDWHDYDYTSKIYEAKGCTTLTAGKTTSYPEEAATLELLTYHQHQGTVKKTRDVGTDKAFRLPSSYRAGFFGYRFTGTKTITSINLAKGMQSLAAYPQ